MSIHKTLADIQKKLKAPKGQMNKFGNYRYRSCEDILEAVKGVKGDLSLVIYDDVEVVDGRVYIKSTVTISDGNEAISAHAYAREPLSKKGMDDSQITGATSSYARKYALNGLFCIDDTKDADSDESPPQDKPEIKSTDKVLWAKAVATFKRDGNLNAALEKFTISKANQSAIIAQAKKAKSESNEVKKDAA